jgi:hypothetical protein
LAQTKKKKEGFCLPMKCSSESYAAGGTPAVVKEYRTQLAASFKQGEQRDRFRRQAADSVPEREGSGQGEGSFVG